ncbi:hypothetical protein MRBLWH7_003533 [Microbacterium sp. LWH7-1.2]|uniref:hypothetical protein n=1 Tax=Microbacterium sp. LWH7-1.2 TaxID=3135257 RepID=UPI0031397061
MDESPVAPGEAPPRDSSKQRARSILPWVIAGLAVLGAAIAVIAFVADEASEPGPVAQLAQDESVEGSFGIDEDVEFFALTASDFVSHGSYGALELWSATTTEPQDTRCLAIVSEDRVSVFRCSAPTIDTIADFPSIDPRVVPPAPSGEPTSYLRFVLHDDVVDVYLAPDPDGGYY